MSTRERFSAQRERLAYEAARILLDQGAVDYDRARRKAAERTGILDRRCWPTNEAIREAVLARRRLLLGDTGTQQLSHLRSAALQAMETLAPFAPRLIGGALSGALGPHEGVELLLFAADPEAVLFLLLDRGIPWRAEERVLRYPDGTRRTHPAFAFLAGDVAIELVVLPLSGQRMLPLDPMTERPIRGADREAVARLLAAEAHEDNAF
ncbi:hypothetical protein CKO25_10005 [Thiocapsa imhoffii]|uniref:Nucleotidyltransferase n=1 Tax=Thiocapsa imhoffii TaxID=382777 RepID=A0A9X0WIY4_9GAMM|nr:hypothetical protein [Thiocapsa imhoffii]MBK1644977.1 hypothetical protein [Thiocapsa imhoffii]